MLKVIFLAALVVFSLTNAADAATVTITLNNGNVSYNLGGTLLPNIDIAHPEIDGNYHVAAAGSSSSANISPTGSLFNNEYLYVTGRPGQNAIFTFSAAEQNTVFGLTWGTIDWHNTLTLKDTQYNHDYTISGFDILTHVAGLTGGKSQLDVVIKDVTGFIKKVTLTSLFNSFEAGNFSAVPLPGAALLFASGLAGLAGVARKKARR